MEPNNYITKEFFAAYQEEVERRLSNLEAKQLSSTEKVNEIGTNVELILQKIDSLIHQYRDDVDLLHQRVNSTKSDVKTLEKDLNNHANVQPSLEYKRMKTQLCMQVISYILLGLIGMVIAFK